MATPSVIGIDVGTTALKAVLIDLNGRRLAEFARPYPISRPEPGAAEQDPRDWMRGVLDALASFSASHDLGGLLSIGICSQVNTHVFTDGNGEPLLPAITWQDGRSAPDAATLDARVTADQKLDWFGGPVRSTPATPSPASPMSGGVIRRSSRRRATSSCPRTIASCS